MATVSLDCISCILDILCVWISAYRAKPFSARLAQDNFVKNPGVLAAAGLLAPQLLTWTLVMAHGAEVTSFCVV
jgi:hypothetical protein